MAQLIEDYALIGNNATAALVGRNGSIDWLCLPRFDSPACFASLIGEVGNGRWLIGPKHEKLSVSRRYRPGTLVLETEFVTEEGTVVLIDCMDRRGDLQDVIRIVRGVRGRVAMVMDLVLRYDYGDIVPWVTRTKEGYWRAVAGPDQVHLATPVDLHGEDMRTRSEFEVAEGEEIPFVFTWSQSHQPMRGQPEAKSALDNVTDAWSRWSRKHTPSGP